MYLRLMVLVCVTLGLFHANQGLLTCKRCMGAAQTKDGAEQACDRNQRSRVCHDKNSICIAFYRNEGGRHLFSRHCASRDGFEKSKMRCDKSILTGRECTVAMCEESGCTAELPVYKPVQRCPTCHSSISLEDCDKNRQLERCIGRFRHFSSLSGTHPGAGDSMRCTVYEMRGSFVRGCMDQWTFGQNRPWITQFGVCRGDECIASFQEAFVQRCPSCESTTSLEDCDQKSELKDCDPSPHSNKCIVYKQSDGMFIRRCMDTQTYGWFHDGSWVKQIGFCEENGCIATFGN